jgi:peptidoglycan/xylan/chitin deacetylase (PgdA/CDA1 family)
VQQGRPDRPLVAFTFHGSGDVGLLDQLLAVATAHRAPLTIFAVGQWLDANAAVARRILNDGNELANHTYTHPSLGSVAPAGVATEITKCRDALQRHAGSPGAWFRPSGITVPNATILSAATAAGYKTVVGFDVDPLDYLDPGAATVRSRTAAALHPGAIVSLHTGHRGTVDAMAGMLQDAAARGLRPVTVTELLAS